MIRATMGDVSGTLSVLISAGADLNLQNQVRYTVIVGTVLHHVYTSS